MRESGSFNAFLCGKEGALPAVSNRGAENIKAKHSFYL
jgi:hypothetical protein